MANFRNRPHLENRQMVQHRGAILNLSGQTVFEQGLYDTYFYNSYDDFLNGISGGTGYLNLIATSGSSTDAVSGYSEHISYQPGKLVLKPARGVIFSGNTDIVSGYTSPIDVTGYIATSIDSDGTVVWSSLSAITSGTCIPSFSVQTITPCSSGGTVTVDGNFTVEGNFTVIGTTTSATTIIETETVRVEDNNIELNYGGNHTTAIGGGITVLSGVSNSQNSRIYTLSDGTFMFEPGISATTIPYVYNNNPGYTESIVTQLGGNDILNSNYSAILAGQDNIISGGTNRNVIVGGQDHVIDSPSGYGNESILGGRRNRITNGGYINTIVSSMFVDMTNSTYSGIYSSGGDGQTALIQDSIRGIIIGLGNSSTTPSIYNGTNSGLYSGWDNVIGDSNGTSDVYRSVILGGGDNKITGSTTNDNIIVGGNGNVIGGSNNRNVINGGDGLNIFESNGSFMAGGELSTIFNGNNNAIIASSENLIDEATDSVILGSYSSKITGITSNMSFVLGGLNGNIFNSGGSGILGGGFSNPQTIISSGMAVILGGDENTINGSNSAVILGSEISTSTGSDVSAILSSRNSDILGNEYGSTIISSNGSDIGPTSPYSTIISTFSSSITGTSGSGNESNYSIIAGGGTNKIFNTSRASIIGGSVNTIKDTSDDSGIFGGSYNTIYDSDRVVILGGYQNTISGHTDASIIGGTGNTINDGQGEIIIGGTDNTITNAPRSIIIGGENITIDGVSNSVSIGGKNNGVDAYGFYESYESIIGGQYNSINGSPSASIIGGTGNTLDTSYNSSILGSVDSYIFLSSGVGACSIIGSERGFIGGSGSKNNVIIGALSGRTDLTNHSAIIGGENNKLYQSHNSLILGGIDNLIDNVGAFRNKNSLIIGGSGNTIDSSTDKSNIVVIGGQGITATNDNTVYVPNLNIGTLGGGASVNNLGIDASGNVVTGTAGGGGGVTIDAYNDVGTTTTINWDVSGTSTNYEVTLNGAGTLNLTNVRNGDYGTIIVEQDGVGSRTLAFGTVNGGAGTHKVVNGGGGSPTLTSTPNAIDLLSFTYNGTTMYWSVGNDYT